MPMAGGPRILLAAATRRRDIVVASQITGVGDDSGTSQGKTRRYGSTLGLASALLCLGASACLNFDYVDEPIPRENHVPVVEVFPAPSFEPLQADVGEPCLPRTLTINALQDADEDILTVRWDVLLKRDERPVRVLLRESPPIPPLDSGEYPLTELTTLTLDRTLLGARLGDLDQQMDPLLKRTQLIELRVSDTGFVADENGDPVADGDGGVTFQSWMVKLTECGVGQ